MADKLVVLGGDGFIGSAVARVAIEEGHEVVSISRSGRPEGQAPWLDAVTWVRGNVLDPESWRHHLNGAKAVVHCVGIIREQPSRGITFERLNGDSVEIAAFEAEKAGVERFVMLSAHEKPPLLSKRYLEAKRRGEQALQRRQFRRLILRPSFVYGPDRPLTLVPGALGRAMGHFTGATDRPLRAEQVAVAAVRAATDLDYEGVITPENIVYLSDGLWGAYRRPAFTFQTLRPYLLGGAALGAVAGLAVAVRR